MSNHKVTVYSTQTCPFCVMAKQYFASRGVEFDDIDVGTDRQAAMEMVQKSGQMGVPVVQIDSQVIVGFQPEAFDRILSAS